MNFIKNELIPRILTPRKKGLFNNRILNGFFRVAGWCATLLFPLYCAFFLEYFNYGTIDEALAFFKNNKEILSLTVSLLYLFFIVVFLIVKKGYIACLSFGLVTFLMGCTNYLKFALTGDYFYPWDFVQAGNLGTLTSFVTIDIPLFFLLAFIGILLFALFTFLGSVQVRANFYVRASAALIIAFVMFINVSTPQRVTKLLNTHSIFLEGMAMQQSNYQDNGFVGAFTVNVLSANIQKPDGYSKEAVENIVKDYEYIPEGEDYKYPDIILILSESFWDPKALPNVTFSDNPTKNFDEISNRDNAYSGSFYSTAFGGGTIRPEFEVVTGLTTDYLPGGCVPYQYINEDTETYVSLYDNLGYRTISLHPYLSSFYSRKSTYPLIGFDEMYFEEDLYDIKDVDMTITGKRISDDSFIDYLSYLMDKEDEPTFLFGISMESHQPYTNKYENHQIEITAPSLNEQLLGELSNYTHGIANADKALKKLVDYIDAREKETVLVYFGDHLPTLGSNYGVYTATGYLNEAYAATREEKDAIQHTPFLIYSNFELGESDIVKKGKDNKLSSYNLMNALSDLISSPKTKLMQFNSDYYSTIPYFNVRLGLAPTATQQAYIEAHKMLTYDVVAGNRYLYE